MAIAARAAAVLGHDRLAELRGEPLRDQPAEDVGRAAGREGQDEAHRPRRIGVLGLNRRHEEEQQKGDESHARVNAWA